MKQKKKEISDMELVISYQKHKNNELGIKSLHEMWNRYEKLRYKMKSELKACCYKNNMNMFELIEEYDSRAWEKFVKAMDGVKPDLSAHIKNWKFYIQLWGYWRSMNRDIIHEFLNTAKNNCQISIFDSEGTESRVSNIDLGIARTGVNSVENIFDQKIKKDIFWKSIDNFKKKLSPKQTIMLAYKQKGFKKSAICKILKIKNSVYEDNMSMVKNMLQQSILDVSKSKKYSVSYNDYL